MARGGLEDGGDQRSDGDAGGRDLADQLDGGTLVGRDQQVGQFAHARMDLEAVWCRQLDCLAAQHGHDGREKNLLEDTGGFLAQALSGEIFIRMFNRRVLARPEAYQQCGGEMRASAQGLDDL